MGNRKVEFVVEICFSLVEVISTRLIFLEVINLLKLGRKFTKKVFDSSIIKLCGKLILGEKLLFYGSNWL